MLSRMIAACLPTASGASAAAAARTRRPAAPARRSTREGVGAKRSQQPRARRGERGFMRRLRGILLVPRARTPDAPSGAAARGSDRPARGRPDLERTAEYHAPTRVRPGATPCAAGNRLSAGPRCGRRRRSRPPNCRCSSCCRAAARPARTATRAARRPLLAVRPPYSRVWRPCRRTSRSSAATAPDPPPSDRHRHGDPRGCSRGR